MERAFSWLDRGVFTIALVLLVLGAAGAGWGEGSSDAVLATQLERSAAAPLYGLVAGVAAYLPVGEPGFRLAVVNALLGAALLVGVLRAARALLPKDPGAGVVSVVLLALSPQFRDVAGFAGPSVLTACAVVWTIALALEHARQPDARRVLGGFACAAIAIGSAPWLGALLGGLVAVWLWRTGGKEVLAIGVFAVGVVIVLLWIGAIGSLPGASPDAAVVVASAGRGAGVIVLGAGLLGAGFAAATGLPQARWLAGAIVFAGGHAAVVDRDPTALLALLAIGCAVIPSGIVRAVPSARRHLVAALAGVPLVGAALLAGPAFGVDDPGPAPARLATDVLGGLPAGPGVFIATREPTWFAIEYAQDVAGARPDLSLAPLVPATTADVVAVSALRHGQLAGSDTPAFGRLDPRLAFPRSRGFQLLLERPTAIAPIPIPARYGSTIGAAQAVILAIDRARYEAVNGRLGLAARAIGLASRFGAADLAILSTTTPSRPAMFVFVPNLEGQPPGPWMIDLLGDDLAWAAGLDVAPVDAPRERKLHTLWRALWRGEIKRDDPAIAALGPAAIKATDEMLAALTKQ